MADAVLVDDATPADVAAITRIFNQGIEDGCTLDMAVQDENERAAWLAGHGTQHPVLAARQHGRVVGWASLNVFNARAVYRFVADISIYVERTERGQGIGSVLMDALIARAWMLGYHKLVLTTFPHLEAGQRLYTRAGFRTVGDYREQGLLNGQWVDVRIMDLLLTETGANT